MSINPDNYVFVMRKVEEEIDKVCEYLEKRGVAYDKIYSSPNACCIESANTIAKLFKQAVHITLAKSIVKMATTLFINTSRLSINQNFTIKLIKRQ